mmetsp:Transcript_131874/g.367645  ORF Transcript_131874/g.367645 Transcript_131874/m.367645 type:complete len:389 (+) Transcript_131874:148-1314(+)
MILLLSSPLSKDTAFSASSALKKSTSATPSRISQDFTLPALSWNASATSCALRSGGTFVMRTRLLGRLDAPALPPPPPPLVSRSPRDMPCKALRIASCGAAGVPPDAEVRRPPPLPPRPPAPPPSPEGARRWRGRSAEPMPSLSRAAAAARPRASPSRAPREAHTAASVSPPSPPLAESRSLPPRESCREAAHSGCPSRSRSRAEAPPPPVPRAEAAASRAATAAAGSARATHRGTVAGERRGDGANAAGADLGPPPQPPSPGLPSASSPPRPLAPAAAAAALMAAPTARAKSPPALPPPGAWLPLLSFCLRRRPASRSLQSSTSDRSLPSASPCERFRDHGSCSFHDCWPSSQLLSQVELFWRHRSWPPRPLLSQASWPSSYHMEWS